MKKLFFFLFLFGSIEGFSGSAIAQTPQDTVWKRGGNIGINLSQVSLSNWSAGGENTIGFDLQSNYTVNYKKERHLWNNRIELDYGLNKTQSDGVKKTNDKIYLSSTYGYEITKNLYLSALMTLQSQFAKGYDYDVNPDTVISSFMAPGYLMAGAGLTWNPKRWFITTFSPATWRGTFVANKKLSDQGAFGVTPGKRLFSEFGANLRLEVNYGFWKNMTVFSRLDLYTNYLKDPQNVDVTWNVQLNMAINKWLSTNITTSMIYDNDTKITQKDGTKGPRLQFKEALGVGLQIKL